MSHRAARQVVWDDPGVLARVDSVDYRPPGPLGFDWTLLVACVETVVVPVWRGIGLEIGDEGSADGDMAFQLRPARAGAKLRVAMRY